RRCVCCSQTRVSTDGTKLTSFTRPSPLNMYVSQLSSVSGTAGSGASTAKRPLESATGLPPRLTDVPGATEPVLTGAVMGPGGSIVVQAGASAARAETKDKAARRCIGTSTYRGPARLL